MGFVEFFCCLIVLFKHGPRTNNKAMERVSGSREKVYYSLPLQKMVSYFKHHGKYIVKFKAFFSE